MKRPLRVILVVAMSLLATALLFVFIKTPLFSIDFFDKDIINFYASYELSTIIISLIFLLLLYCTADTMRLSYLTLKHIKAPIRPVPVVGIKPKKGEGWSTYGLTVGMVITVVTGIVMYLQVYENGLGLRFLPEVPLVIVLALMNSFTEEIIFRLSYTTIIANEGGSPRISEILSAVIFGAVHYFGIAPNGIIGALMAAFIGWFLAKSINETKGFFWAWTIHFAQDVVILFFLFQKG